MITLVQASELIAAQARLIALLERVIREPGNRVMLDPYIKAERHIIEACIPR